MSTKIQKPTLTSTSTSKTPKNKREKQNTANLDKVANKVKPNISANSKVAINRKVKPGTVVMSKRKTNKELDTLSTYTYSHKRRSEDGISNLSQTQTIQTKNMKRDAYTPKSIERTEAKKPTKSIDYDAKVNKSKEKRKATLYVAKHIKVTSKTATITIENSRVMTKAHNTIDHGAASKKKLNVLNKESQTDNLLVIETKEDFTQSEQEEVKEELKVDKVKDNNTQFSGAKLSYYTNSNCINSIDIPTEDLSNITVINELLKEFSKTLFNNNPDLCLSINPNTNTKPITKLDNTLLLSQSKQTEITFQGIQTESQYRGNDSKTIIKEKQHKVDEGKKSFRDSKGDPYTKLRDFLKTKIIKTKQLDTIPAKKNTVKPYYKSRSIDYGKDPAIFEDDGLDRFDTSKKVINSFLLKQLSNRSHEEKAQEKEAVKNNEKNYLELDKPVLKNKQKPKMQEFNENYTKAKELEDEAEMRVKETMQKAKNLRNKLKKK